MSMMDDGWDYCRLTIRPHSSDRVEEDEELPLLLALVDDLEQLSVKGWHLTSIGQSRCEDVSAFDVVLKRERVAVTLPLHVAKEDRESDSGQVRRAA